MFKEEAIFVFSVTYPTFEGRDTNKQWKYRPST